MVRQLAVPFVDDMDIAAEMRYQEGKYDDWKIADRIGKSRRRREERKEKIQSKRVGLIASSRSNKGKSTQ